MADIAMLVAEEYERRVNKYLKKHGGPKQGVFLGLTSQATTVVQRVKSKIGQEIFSLGLDPKTQVALQASDGLFSAWLFLPLCFICFVGYPTRASSLKALLYCKRSIDQFQDSFLYYSHRRNSIIDVLWFLLCVFATKLYWYLICWFKYLMQA